MNTSFRLLFLSVLAPAVIIASNLVAPPLAAQSLFDVNFSGGRSHPFDVLHIAIDLRFDEPKEEVIGTVTHRMRSLDPALRDVRLDAAGNMKLSRVVVNGTPAAFDLEKESLTIHLPSPRAYGDTFSIAIDYRVVPEKGLYFIHPDSLRPDARQQIWTQGEAEDNHFWVPLYDYPNDLATSELTATVRGEWKALSNGDLKSMKRNSDGTATWRYALDKPHASYLVMFAAGDYLVTRDSVNGVALQYWSYPDMPDRVEPTFGRTPDIIRYFERLLGVPYPWHSYSQIFIEEFMYGGMENTTATTLNDYLLIDRRGRLDVNPDNTISHEIAHQWYGDLVTNRSWGHLWLHESYASYLAARYIGYRYGEDAFQKEMNRNGRIALATDAEDGRDPLAKGRGLTPNLYQRGARVLYMLNQLLGDDLFWRANRLYLQRHGHGLAETNDLKIAIEDVTGADLGWFFDQWVYGAGAPEFVVESRYEGDSVRLYVKQVQQRDSLTGLFRMPVPVEAYTASGVIRDTLWVAHEYDTLAFAAGEPPRFVIFDAGDAMLKKVTFKRGEDELIAQLQAPRMIDRLLAVQALGDSGSSDPASSTRPEALRAAYMRERSEVVREEIVDAITHFTAPAAEEVIQRALADTSVDVRETGIDAAWRIADRDRRAALLEPLLSDSSRNVSMAAIGVMAATRPAGLEPYLRATAGVRGRRDRLVRTWLGAVMNGKFNSLVERVVQYTQPRYSRTTRSQALMVLGRLDTMNADVRSAIERGLQDQSDVVFTSALAAAGRHLDESMRQMLVQLRDENGLDKKREEQIALELENKQKRADQ
jgi:aminopeptidase N